MVWPVTSVNQAYQDCLAQLVALDPAEIKATKVGPDPRERKETLAFLAVPD